MKIKNQKRAFVFLMILGLGFFLSGCGEMLGLAIMGAGKSATIEDTGFLQSYDGLAPATDHDKKAYPNLPDLYFISPKINMKAYKKIIVADFTSRNPDRDKLVSLGLPLYKTLRKDLADDITETFEGSVFKKIVRISEKIDPKDIAEIRKLPADAVLMGNIKELISVSELTSAQVEYKLIDIKTGEEVLKAIQRNTTDEDKVIFAQRKALSELFNKAKAGNSP